MLTHLNSEPRFAERTVVIGAGGFVGGAIVRWLEAVQKLPNWGKVNQAIAGFRDSLKDKQFDTI